MLDLVFGVEGAELHPGRIASPAHAHVLQEAQIGNLASGLRRVDQSGPLSVIGLDTADVVLGAALQRVQQLFHLRLELSGAGLGSLGQPVAHTATYMYTYTTTSTHHTRVSNPSKTYS